MMTSPMHSTVLRHSLLAILALCGAAATSASADVATVTLTPSNASNNFLYNNSPASNFSGSQLYWYDQRGASNDSARPLLQFGLASLPAGAVITSATLQLKVATYTFIDVNHGNATVPWPFAMYQMTTPWSNTQSNWTQATSTTNWNSPGLGAGTDYNSTALDTQTISSANVGNYVSWNITSAYLSWVANPSTNYGVTLFGPAGVPGAGNTTSTGDTTDGVFQAYSTNYANPSFQPTLVVNYTVPAPGTAAGLCFGGLLLARRRRATR